MDSRSPRPARRQLPLTIIEYGRAAALPEARSLRFHDSSCEWAPAGVLAGLFELARQVLTGSRCGAAARPAANRFRILRTGRHGASRTAGKIVASVFRSRLGIHV